VLFAVSSNRKRIFFCKIKHTNRSDLLNSINSRSNDTTYGMRGPQLLWERFSMLDCWRKTFENPTNQKNITIKSRSIYHVSSNTQNKMKNLYWTYIYSVLKLVYFVLGIPLDLGGVLRAPPGFCPCPPVPLRVSPWFCACPLGFACVPLALRVSLWFCVCPLRFACVPLVLRVPPWF